MSGTHKTLNPPPDDAVAPTSAQRKGKSVRSYAVTLRAMFAIFTMLITDRARAFLMARLSVAAARTLGMRASPSDIADEFLRCLAAYGPLVQQKRLPGYGPMRARFGLELAQGIEASLERYRAMRPEVRGAAAARDGAMERTEAMRAGVVTGLRNLAGDDDEAVGRVRAVASPKRAADDHLRAMDQLAHEIVQARDEVPPELLDDAGLSPEVLDAVQETTRGAAEARTSSRGQRAAQQQLRAELAEPCGRIYNELKALLRAARTARKHDPTVPDVTSWLVRRPAAAKPAQGPAPAPPPDAPR